MFSIENIYTDTDTDNLFSIENHKHLQIRNKMKIIKVNYKSHKLYIYIHNTIHQNTHSSIRHATLQLSRRPLKAALELLTNKRTLVLFIEQLQVLAVENGDKLNKCYLYGNQREEKKRKKFSNIYCYFQFYKTLILLILILLLLLLIIIIIIL